MLSEAKSVLDGKQENQPSFFERFKWFWIILIVIILVAVAVLAILKTKPSTKQSPSQVSTASFATTKSLFGTMIAFNINEAMGVPSAGVPSIIGALQKGWTQFRKDDSAYQNLKSNLKKLIQDRTKLVKTTGFSIDRGFNYFTWNVIEPQKGQFDWELTDIYAKGASDTGAKISAVVQPFAVWDQKNTSSLANCNALDFAFYDYKAGPPNDLAEYKNFLTKTVERYKDNVTVWEIGNEYDSHCGGYENNPEGYFDLVKISSETIKKVDPSAKVTNGGAMPIVGMPESDLFKVFWTKFFALGGNRYLDYFNVHYNIERSQDAKLSPAIFQENLTFFNNLMDKNGGRKPLYLTEFGIYSGTPSAQGPGQSQTNSVTQPIQGQTPIQDIQPNQGQTLSNLSPSDQAVLYFKDSIIAFANGAKVVFIDLIGDDNLIGSSMAFNTNGQPRLFLTALKTIDQKLAGFSKTEKITEGQYKFMVDGKIIYVLWTGTLPSEISGKVKVTDIKGQEQTLDATAIKLNADQPVLIESQ